MFGSKVGIPYKWLFVALAFLGSIVKLDLILNLGDGLLGLVVIPNSIAILLLSPLVIKMTKDYFHKLHTGEIKPYKSSPFKLIFFKNQYFSMFSFFLIMTRNKQIKKRTFQK